MSAPPSLVALVVTCNRLEQLRVTVARLLAEPVDRVLVVDNGSSDGTAAWLAAEAGPRLVVERLDRNTGGAGGFAHGLAVVRDRLDPDWVVTMDDDARPAPGALAAFRAGPPQDSEAVAAAVRFPDGRICEMNRPMRNPFAGPVRLLRALGRRGSGSFRVPDAAYAAGAAPREIDMASFVGLFLSRAALARHPGPDPRLFLYGDDLLYTLALTRAGVRLVFDPRLRFEHDCATLAGGTRIYSPVWKVYYTYRNGILLYRQVAGPIGWALLALRLPAWWAAGRHYGTERPAYLRMLHAAVRDGSLGRLDGPPTGVPGPLPPDGSAR